jgi:uncharacterized protein (TIGR02145 family)
MRKTTVKISAIVFIVFMVESLQAQTVKDIEGNIYKTVKIGSQVWMAENLKTTKYNDGTEIPIATDNAAWNALVTPSYCYYDNLKIYKDTFGALYNWYTLNSTSNRGKNVCPTGWHIPTSMEWNLLMKYLGGSISAGGKLKEVGTAHWIAPNDYATNESGFTALAGGNRGSNGKFNRFGYTGNWWSSTNYSASEADGFCINYDLNDLTNYSNNKKCGYSVRCIKD